MNDLSSQPHPTRAQSIARSAPAQPRSFSTRSLSALAVSGLVLSSCGGGGGGTSSLLQDMQIVEASNGFGTLLPHRVNKLENGVPTTPMFIRTMADLMANVTPNNLILPSAPWESDPILSTGEAGNHFLFVRFTQPIDLDSIFDRQPGSSINSNLSGSVSLVGTDPDTGTTQSIPARVLVGGVTVGLTAVDGLLPYETWVLPNGAQPIAATIDGAQPGLGFPGTQSPYQNAVAMVQPETLVVIADSDNDLSTHDTFPAGVQIKLAVGQGVRSVGGNALAAVGVASATVGLDSILPEVAVSLSGFNSFPLITPGGGMVDVDPQTAIKVELTEPVQPTSLGQLDNGQPAGASSAVIVTFGPEQSKTTVPFNVRPFSVFDLTTYQLVPGFNFPGTGPTLASCGTFSRVDIGVSSQQLQDLAGNRNGQTAATFFETGEGPGLVNAPVAPDVIYIGRTGSQPGISVLDLNGFGASTGNPTFDPFNPIVQGNSNFPNNQNVSQGNLLIPPITAGTCTFNGGSEGVFSLTRDSLLQDKLIRPPLIDSVGDLMIGQPLDISFNNGPPPFGCQAGTPNLCASSGLKQPTPVASGLGLTPAQPGQFSTVPPGVGNLIAWAPHPNPPPLVFPPPCVSPLIAGQEPTSIDTLVANLLSPSGDPFGNPAAGIPPSGLLANLQNGFFQGPSLPASTLTACTPYSIRQQVGHFLYMIDRVSREIVVLNSNRFSVIDRIALPDPTALAMAPNADLLAVSNRGANLVSLIDIDPRSASFHQIVKTIPVGNGPSGIAWQPDNEDILVCNELDNSLSIISVFSLQVRKTINTTLDRPFEVVVAPRQPGGPPNAFHMSRTVYFAYILNRNGRVAFFESGPDGANGFGADSVIGQVPFTFNAPKSIAIDIANNTSAFYVLHEGQLGLGGAPTGIGGGAITRVLVSGFNGPVPLSINQGAFSLITRQVDFTVSLSVGPDVLTGVPVDLAFDNSVNLGGTFGLATIFGPGLPAPVNNKNMMSTGGVPSVSSRFMFVAVPNSSQGTGAVDVLELDNGLQRYDVNVFEPGVQSVRASGATFLCDYWKQ
jgi:YVTN family beta-propeller protein